MGSICCANAINCCDSRSILLMYFVKNTSFVHFKLGLLQVIQVPLPLETWINDGLMAIFFVN
jgi:Na+/H+ antiporter NhaA